VDATVTRDDLDRLFAYFISVDHTFSTYKETSEISRLNRGELSAAHASESMKTILVLSEQTKKETHGYFDIQRDGISDPSGIVKGWAIQNAAQMLENWGFRHFYIDAGGDIQVAGNNHGKLWRIGIRNPFNRSENVKVLALTDRGVATSGTAIRGQHIYNPYHRNTPILDIVSLTVIGPNIYEADRFSWLGRDPGDVFQISPRHTEKTYFQKHIFNPAAIAVVVTAFTMVRSILKYLLDTQQRRDIVLLYANKSAKEIVYQDVLSAASTKLGVKVFCTLTDTMAVPRNWTSFVGRINEQMIMQAIPDYAERMYYLSGPPDMVRAYEQVLKRMYIKSSQIKKDFFPGLV